MTTVAWDGKILAVDSQGTSDLSRVEDIVKLHSTSDMCIALAGDYQDFKAVWDWFRTGEEEDKPIVSDNLSGILIKDGVSYEFFEKLRLCEINGPRTCGSGWKWAAAAMDQGSNAIDAIEYASTKCIYTGGPVQSWTMPISKNNET